MPVMVKFMPGREMDLDLLSEQRIQGIFRAVSLHCSGPAKHPHTTLPHLKELCEAQRRHMQAYLSWAESESSRAISTFLLSVNFWILFELLLSEITFLLQLISLLQIYLYHGGYFEISGLCPLGKKYILPVSLWRGGVGWGAMIHVMNWRDTPPKILKACGTQSPCIVGFLTPTSSSQTAATSPTILLRSDTSPWG